jgi:hypothetical protein
MFWFDLPWWIRLLAGLIVASAGAALLFLVDVTLGVIVLALAVGMLITGGTDNSDRRGYKF